MKEEAFPRKAYSSWFFIWREKDEQTIKEIGSHWSFYRHWFRATLCHGPDTPNRPNVAAHAHTCPHMRLCLWLAVWSNSWSDPAIISQRHLGDAPHVSHSCGHEL